MDIRYNRIELIHADAFRAEIEQVDLYSKFDASIRSAGSLEDNSFQLLVDDWVWSQSPIREGHYLYVSGSEWGGCVEEVKHSTSQRQMSLSGATWRGMFLRKAVVPPEGQTHFVIPTMEANAALAYLVGDMFGDLVTFDSSSTGVSVNGQYRNKKLLEAIEDLLGRFGLRMYCHYRSDLRKVIVGATPTVDYSSRIDLSQDYGVHITTKKGRIDAYNHIIALGSGQMEDREVLHVYRSEDGVISEVRPEGWGGIADKVYIYDYANAETRADLLNGAVNKAKEFAGEVSVEIDASVLDISLELSDIVGARDRLTGLAAKAAVVAKILRSDVNGVDIQTLTESLSYWEGGGVVPNEIVIESILSDSTLVQVGEAIVWTVIASGGNGALYYMYRLYKGGTLIDQTGQLASNTYAYIPNEEGTYQIIASVTDGDDTKSGYSANVVVEDNRLPEFTYTYTGVANRQEVVMDGVEYILHTLTTSGTFTPSREVQCDMWACAGGNAGYYQIGGTSGWFIQKNGVTLVSADVEIGVGGVDGVNDGSATPTQFGTLLNTRNGIRGSGNGMGGSPDGIEMTGPGGGVTTYPFANSTIFAPHCAGGGGAEVRGANGRYYAGSDGESNGASTVPGSTVGVYTSTVANRGVGGDRGGGSGGWSGSANGTAASFYGSGGGGTYRNLANNTGGTPGSGYRGVLYIRIRKDA